jgi:hypothetical protein
VDRKRWENFNQFQIQQTERTTRMNRIWKHLFLCGLLISATCVTTGCGGDSGPSDAPKETTPEPGDTTLLEQNPYSQIS